MIITINAAIFFIRGMFLSSPEKPRKVAIACLPTERVIPGGSLCVRAIADIVPCIGIRIEPSDYQVAIGEHDIFTGVGSQWGRSHLLPG